MTDEILEKMRGRYEHRFRNDQKLKRIRKKLQNGANQAVAQEYAVAAGEILSDVLKENVTADLFGEAMPDAATLAGLIIPMMEQNYTHVVTAASASQKYMNSEGNLGMKPIEPEFDRNAAMNIVGRMANYDSFEDAEWLMDEPIRTNSQHIADESLRENAEFQYRSGLKPKIVRTCESDACEWCQMLEGEYDYEDVKGRNDPVYQRHNNCACEITYEPGDGRVQDVYSKQWYDDERAEERIAYSASRIRSDHFHDSARKSSRIDLAQQVYTRRYIGERGKEVIDKPTYNKLTKDFIRKGGLIRQDQEAVDHLDKMKAGAAYLPSFNTVLFRPEPTISEVLEEMFHAQQDRRNVFSNYPNDEILLRREIQAQEYLLSVSKRYKIPIEEQETTLKNLEDYRNDLKELLMWKNGV